MKIDIITFILVCVFSIGTWIDICSIFSQLSFLISILPEKYEIYSHFSLIIQLANISPLIYGIIRRYKPKYADERISIYIILIGCTITQLIVAFTYDISLDFGGKSYSFPLLFCVFILACFDCLSTVTMYSFMSIFPQRYLSAFFIGMSLSSLIPSMLTLIQGSTMANSVENSTSFPKRIPKNFSTRIYFLIISFVILCSSFAFSSISYFYHFKTKMVISYQEYREKKVEENSKDIDENSESGDAGIFSYYRKRLVNSFATINSDTFQLLFSVFIVGFITNGINVQIISYASRAYHELTLILASNIMMGCQAITNMIMISWKFASRVAIGAIMGSILLITLLIVTIAILGKNGMVIVREPYGTIIVVSIFDIIFFLEMFLNLFWLFISLKKFQPCLSLKNQ